MFHCAGSRKIRLCAWDSVSQAGNLYEQVLFLHRGLCRAPWLAASVLVGGASGAQPCACPVVDPESGTEPSFDLGHGTLTQVAWHRLPSDLSSVKVTWFPWDSAHSVVRLYPQFNSRRGLKLFYFRNKKRLVLLKWGIQDFHYLDLLLDVEPSRDEASPR